MAVLKCSCLTFSAAMSCLDAKKNLDLYLIVPSTLMAPATHIRTDKATKPHSHKDIFSKWLKKGFLFVLFSPARDPFLSGKEKSQPPAQDREPCVRNALVLGSTPSLMIPTCCMCINSILGSSSSSVYISIKTIHLFTCHCIFYLQN